MIHNISYGSRTIPYRLERRPVKRLTLRVAPSGNLEVTAPLHAEEEEIQKRLVKKAAWVVKQQRAFAEMRICPMPDQLSAGTSFRYLGRQYRIRIRVSTSESVKLGRGELSVMVVDKSNAPRLIESWLKVKAEQKLQDRILICSEIARSHKIGLGHFRLRAMPKRWGSCSARGLILLNPALVRAPVDCIDYVILHEVCHLRYLSHRREFYKLLYRVLPDWERRKSRLERLNV